METIISNNHQNESLLKEKCHLHQSESLDFVNFTRLNESPLMCFCCAKKKRIPANEMIKVSEIMNANDETLLTFFPPFTSNELWDELIDICEESQSVEQQIQKIETFTKEFTDEITNALNVVNKNAKCQIIQLVSSKERIKETYNKMASKAEIQKTFLNTSSKDDLCGYLQKILTDKMNEKQENSQKIEQVMAEHKLLSSKLSFEIPNKLKQSILRMIKNVDFFSGVNEEQFQEIVGESRSGTDEESEIEKGKTNAKLITDLIKSKANFCSKDFEQQIETIIKSFSGSLKVIELGDCPFDTDKRNAFQALNSEQMDKIILLSHKIIENTNDIVAKSSIQNSSFLSIKSKSTCAGSQVQSLISSNLENNIFEVNQTMLGNVFEQQQQQQQLAFDQVDFRQDDPSQNVFELLEDKISSEDERKALKALLSDYPIFSLANIHFEKQLMKTVNFIPAQNQIPSQIDLSYGPNHICMTSIGQQAHKVAYCDFKLNPDKKYVIRVMIQKNVQTKDTHFLFGLIPEQDKDTKQLSKTALAYSEFSNSFGMSTVIKGKNLHRGYQNEVNRQFEMRIHLKEKFMRVADYPEYQNVCTLDDPNSIESNEEYRFATEFFYLNDSFIINQISEVANFNNQM